MFFDLCNVSKKFQTFINEVLKKCFNNFCSKYLNNIFIYNNTRKKHEKHVFKMFERFIEIDFYLNIDKCEFFITKIKYLNLIIIIEKIKMNSKKLKLLSIEKHFVVLKIFEHF